MSLREDIRALLSQLPGRHAHLESVRFLHDPESFYSVAPDGKVEVLRPEWLGPEPTITRVSEIPVELTSAYDAAHSQGLFDVLWDDEGDGHLYLNKKGIAALSEAAPESAQVAWLGSGKVRIGNRTITLEPQLANVLEALVKVRSATTPELQKESGYSEAVALLKKIVDKFPDLKPHIYFPGRRGAGGYSTTIRPE